jgi:xanthosine utilization system XapX-like protein
VGYTTAQVGKLVMAEYRFLLAAGLAVGTAAALLAVVPAAAQPGVNVPFGLLALFLVGTAALSLGWIWLAARLALRSPLIAALRNE